MGADSRINLQLIVGLLCAIILALALYQSGSPDWSYNLITIIGMLALIAILLEKHDLLIRAIRAWRGSDDTDAQQRIDELNDRLEAMTERRADERDDGKQRDGDKSGDGDGAGGGGDDESH